MAALLHTSSCSFVERSWQESRHRSSSGPFKFKNSGATSPKYEKISSYGGQLISYACGTPQELKLVGKDKSLTHICVCSGLKLCPENVFDGMKVRLSIILDRLNQPSSIKLHDYEKAQPEHDITLSTIVASNTFFPLKYNRRLLLSSLLSGLTLLFSQNSVISSSKAAELKDEAGGREKNSGRNESQGNVLFREVENGVTVLDIRDGNGAFPASGDKVAIHYYARLAAKQGWRFDSTYDHKDSDGAPQPFEFVLDSSSVIAGLSTAVKGMRVGGTRRAVIPPTQGYQTTADEPLPPNFFDRQRLFTTIFNPTRIQNGEGSTLGTLVFDIQLLGIRPPS